jgi:hypothetical protein
MDASMMQLLLKYLRNHGKDATLRVIEEFIKNKEAQAGNNYGDLRKEMINFITELTE